MCFFQQHILSAVMPESFGFQQLHKMHTKLFCKLHVRHDMAAVNKCFCNTYAYCNNKPGTQCSTHTVSCKLKHIFVMAETIVQFRYIMINAYYHTFAPGFFQTLCIYIS